MGIGGIRMSVHPALSKFGSDLVGCILLPNDAQGRPIDTKADVIGLTADRNIADRYVGEAVAFSSTPGLQSLARVVERDEDRLAIGLAPWIGQNAIERLRGRNRALGRCQGYYQDHSQCRIPAAYIVDRFSAFNGVILS